MKKRAFSENDLALLKAAAYAVIFCAFNRDFIARHLSTIQTLHPEREVFEFLFLPSNERINIQYSRLSREIKMTVDLEGLTCEFNLNNDRAIFIADDIYNLKAVIAGMTLNKYIEEIINYTLSAQERESLNFISILKTIIAGRPTNIVTPYTTSRTEYSIVNAGDTDYYKIKYYGVNKEFQASFNYINQSEYKFTLSVSDLYNQPLRTQIALSKLLEEIEKIPFAKDIIPLIEGSIVVEWSDKKYTIGA